MRYKIAPKDLLKRLSGNGKKLLLLYGQVLLISFCYPLEARESTSQSTFLNENERKTGECNMKDTKDTESKSLPCTETEIRQIGDLVLHSRPIDCAATDKEKICSYVHIMKEAQLAYKGVGIACNQCEIFPHPKQICLIGSDDPDMQQEIEKRYPNESLPCLTVMINPVILQCEGPYYPSHGEGCLSVWGSLRGKVKRYSQIAVRYQDEEGEIKEQSFTGFAAHIIQHECDHLSGITFLEKILQDCTEEQNLELYKLVNEELEYRKNNHLHKEVNKKEIMRGKLVFDREGDQVIVNKELLTEALRACADRTLIGILLVLHTITGIDT